VTSRDLTPFGSVAVCLERQSFFSAVVGRHTAGVASRSVRCPRVSCQGAERGVAKQAGVATGGPLFTICTKRGVGTWWRRNSSGTVSVTWRSVPGGYRSRAQLVLTVVPVGPGRRWFFLFGAKRTGGGRKAGWSGSLTAGRNGPGRRGKAGWPGFPRNGRERARTTGESGMAGVPSQREGTGQDKGRKRNGRGFLTMGRNGPGQRGKAGWPGFPHSGKERARTKGGSGLAGVPSQREGTGQREESGMSARSEAESESEVVSEQMNGVSGTKLGTKKLLPPSAPGGGGRSQKWRILDQN
jgi:hypothetical protein